MKLVEKIKRVLQTDGFLRQESSRWASQHFDGERQEKAQAVGYALVSTLGVDFKQLNQHTNIVADLGADEWTEWAEIQMSLETELDFYFCPQPEFTGRTITELVDFISQPSLPRLPAKPKRAALSSHDWCLAGYLRNNS